LPFSGLNLFLDGNGSIPGISVFGPVGSPGFLPNPSSTLSLEGNSIPGSGTSFYRSAGVVVVLTGYEWNNSATPPGDVSQPFAFTPNPYGDASAFGSLTLTVWPAATLSLSQTRGGHLGAPPIFASATTDTSGSFSVAAAEPQHPYSPMDVFAVGASSRKLGAATLSVTPDLATSPSTASPGGTTKAYGFGFGSGETVDIYWNNPRQLLGTATANGEGSSALTIAVPANAPPGINAVIGVGQATKAIGIGAVKVQ
jgi:hypothetical protein